MRILAALICSLLGLCSATAALFERQANTTLQLTQGQAPTNYLFVITNAFPGVTFTSPVAIVTPPGETNRLFVVQQGGQVRVITNLAAPNSSVFLDLTGKVQSGGEAGLLGMAFHPGWRTNRYFFIFYSLNTTTTNVQTGQRFTGLHQRVSRFQFSETNPNVAVPASEAPLITQYDEANNHNGGDLHFGPDGYLYISLGDEGGQNDQFQNSQRLDKDFFSGILRIDVDGRPGNLAPTYHPAIAHSNEVAAARYWIPADNPFIGVTNFSGRVIDQSRLRAEFFAVGLRNPWRMSFDPLTGELYVGDVGGSLREEINLIVPGGNYGWAHREGTSPGPRVITGGITSEMFPILQYGHGSGTNQGTSVTGGVVYRGTNAPALTGLYFFTDYISGNLWVIQPNGTNVASGFRRIASAPAVAGLGYDPRNGDVLLARHQGNSISRVGMSPQGGGGPAGPPALLSETGVFRDLLSLTPNAGIYPYEVNHPFWSDGADKLRWFSVPRHQDRIEFNPEGNWSFPGGTVWIKNFHLATNDSPESVRRLETRILVKTDEGVDGFTYRWTNNANAVLVPEEGLNEPIVVQRGGIIQTQIWSYPSRAQCQSCHTPAGGFALGFNTEQLNRNVASTNGLINQLLALRDGGFLQTNNLERLVPSALRTLAHVNDTNATVEHRVRSYLAVNCAQCHQPGGGSSGTWDARLRTPLSLSGIINGVLNNNMGNPSNRVVVPGDSTHSMLLKRMEIRGPGQMPPHSSNIPDVAANDLIRRWIDTDLVGYQTFEDWQRAQFGTATNNVAAMEDFDNDRASNWQEYLLKTSPTNSADFYRLTLTMEAGTPTLHVPILPNRLFQVEVATNLNQPILWTPLDHPQNSLVPSASFGTNTIRETNVGGEMRIYRVKISEQ
jgi:uncharacterized repeat protein (TIGR03806 family)